MIPYRARLFRLLARPGPRLRGILGGSGGLLRESQAVLGASEGDLGWVFGRLGNVLGPSCGVLRVVHEKPSESDGFAFEK